MPTVILRSACAGLLIALVGTSIAQAQPVSVTAADPPQGEQSTVGLVVRITGKNFASGARVDFFRSGTSETAGVVVRSAVVTKATEIQATVDIAPEAALSFFDIRVTNLSGRSGKGSDLFQVVQKVTGQNACVVQPPPANISMVQRLNSLDNGGQPRYQGGLGHGMAAMTLSIKDTATLLLAAPSAPAIEIFFLTERPDGTADVDVVNPHRRLTAPDMTRLFPTAIGDFNADGAPDIVAGNRLVGRAFVWLGLWDPLGELDFGPAIPIPPPPSVDYYSDDIAVGDLDPAYPGDEIAIGQWGVRQGKGRSTGRVYLYRVSGTSVLPLPKATVVPSWTQADDVYAQALTIADVTGTSSADLIVSAHWRDIPNGGTGEVYVFPGPTFDVDATTPGLQPFVIRPHAARERFGFGLGIGDVNDDGTADVLINNFYNVATLTTDAALGPIGPGHITAAGYATEQPQNDANMGFGTTGAVIGDLDGDGHTDMVVGAPDSTSGGSCTKQGTVFIWRGTGQPGAAWHSPYAIQAPERDADAGHFGWRNLIVQVGQHAFLVVGEPQRDLGSVAAAGQIYLYRVTSP
jgi:hypothetical protein